MLRSHVRAQEAEHMNMNEYVNRTDIRIDGHFALRVWQKFPLKQTLKT